MPSEPSEQSEPPEAREMVEYMELEMLEWYPEVVASVSDFSAFGANDSHSSAWRWYSIYWPMYSALSVSHLDHKSARYSDQRPSAYCYSSSCSLQNSSVVLDVEPDPRRW